jgi:hypothetical protein
MRCALLPAVAVLGAACVPMYVEVNPTAHLDFDGQARPVALAFQNVTDDQEGCDLNGMGFIRAPHFEQNVRRAFERAAREAGFRLASAGTMGTTEVTIDQMALGCSPGRAIMIWTLEYHASSSDGGRAHGHLQRVAGGGLDSSNAVSVLVAEAVEDLSTKLLQHPR